MFCETNVCFSYKYFLDVCMVDLRFFQLQNFDVICLLGGEHLPSLGSILWFR